MQLPHLFEQRLEHLLVHARTLLRLAAETAECLHEPLTHAPLVLQEQDAAKLSEPGRWIVEPENALAVLVDRQGEDPATDSRRGKRGAVSEWTQRERR
jgi:hypothetical protein